MHNMIDYPELKFKTFLVDWPLDLPVLTQCSCRRHLTSTFAAKKQLITALSRNRDQSPASVQITISVLKISSDSWKSTKISTNQTLVTSIVWQTTMNKPCHWTQLSQTRETPNPHFHSTNPTHCLPFLLCPKKNFSLKNRTSDNRTPKKKIFEFYPLQDTAILFHIRCWPKLSKSFN